MPARHVIRPLLLIAVIAAVVSAFAAAASAGGWGPQQGDGGWVYWNVDAAADGGMTAIGQGDGGYVTPVQGTIDVTMTTENLFRTQKEGPPPPSNLPDPPSTIGTIGIPAWGPNQPDNPFGYTPPQLPFGVCSDGKGWSFEFTNGAQRPTYGVNGWQAAGLFATQQRGPVFGNNVDINRMMPPGFIADQLTNSANQNIGGDYWRFSRDVNQQGNWWVGSSDTRLDWTQLPGQRIAEGATGTLTSANVMLMSSYITFLIGGTADGAERVELWVLSDGTAADIQHLQSLYDGLGTSELPPDATPPAFVEGNWVLVRASSNTVQNDYMQRRVVWNVPGFVGRTARFRIVDDVVQSIGTTARAAHINVDDIHCTNTMPSGTNWLLKHIGSFWIQSNVGSQMKTVPIWGVTDTHAHVLSNLAFGGHLVWGDPGDALSTVYNCQNPLPDMVDKNGVVVRGGTPPGLTAAQHISCKVQPDILAAMTAEAEATCQAAAIVPFVGPGLVAACMGAVADAAYNLATTSVFDADTYHNATAASSGGISLGPWLDSIASIFGAGVNRQQGVIEQIDWDLADGTHSGHSLGKLHNQYQADMIKRAWQGGLRLVGVDTINGRAMQWGLDGAGTVSDWQAIQDMVTGVVRLTNCNPNHPRFPVGPLCGIAEIAFSPADARVIIARNHVALVLGVEVDELGKMRGPNDSISKQVQDLFSLGIRKVTMVHGLDNPLGGTGLFQDIYNNGSVWTNLTKDENGHEDGVWQPWNPDIPIYMSIIFPVPFAGMLLGAIDMGQRIESPSPCEQTANGPAMTNCVWNQAGLGWIKVAESLPSSSVDWIQHYDDVQFRFGFMSAAAPLEAYTYPAGDWINLNTLGTGVQLFGYQNGIPIHDISFSGGLSNFIRLNNLGWLVGNASSGPDKFCSLDGMILPTPANSSSNELPAFVIDNTMKLDQHVNARGLSDSGVQFVREMMQRGMIVDLDHFSQASRIGAYQLARDFGNEAYGTSNLAVYDYPLFGVHTDIRGLNKHGPVPDIKAIRDNFGYGSETDRTEDEVKRVATYGGALSPGANAGLVTPNSPLTPTSINNTCDFSSKSWALKYLRMMKLMSGKGITPSTDFNGLASVMAPRYGMNACHTVEHAAFLASDNKLDDWPRDWASNVMGNPVPPGCMFNTTKPGAQWNTSCPSTMMVNKQYAEGNGVEYDDYVPAQLQPQNAGNVVYMQARGPLQKRDDAAPRTIRNEIVAVGKSNQMAKLKKFKTTAAIANASVNTGWDFNLDGLKHIGLYPDFLQDVRNDGVTWEQMTPLFNASEDYAQMWEKSCGTANKWRALNGLAPVACQ